MRAKYKVVIPSLVSILLIVGCHNGTNSSTQTTSLSSVLKTASDCTGTYSLSNINSYVCPPGLYFVANGTDLSTINEDLLNQNQPTAQWTNNRYAILLAANQPTYTITAPSTGAVPTFELGYYTQILGLGKHNSEVTVAPGVQVHNQCGLNEGDPQYYNTPGNNNTPPVTPNTACLTTGGLNNFWRGIENFTMDNSALNSDVIFAVSQAAPIRSVTLTGNGCTLYNSSSCDGAISLCDYLATGSSYACGYTSGGFMANSTITTLAPGSQQQWLTRNSNLGSSGTAVWNSVFVGNNISSGPTPPTTLAPNVQTSGNNWSGFPVALTSTTPIINEKPYLVCESCTNIANAASFDWKVEVPKLRTGATGIDTTTPTELDVNTQFYIVSPGLGTTTNGVTTLNGVAIAGINTALASGKNLIITPGVYNLDGGSINVTNNNTVVLGLGLPSLVCTSTSPCINISAAQGVQLSGLTLDAGYNLTPSLLQIGSSTNSQNNSANPIVLHDIFARIAETQSTIRQSPDRQTVAAIVIYTNNVIGDNLWLWRADHDNASGHSETAADNLVTWNQDQAQYGLVVYGNSVTMYGLAVEHFRDYQTYWYGQNGSVYFYQSEMPYTVPSLSQWTCHTPENPSSPTTESGCASYVVDPTVTSHTALGLGVYTYFAESNIVASSAILAPAVSGVSMTDIVGQWLNGNESSGIGNLVNTYSNTCFGIGTQIPGTLASPGQPVSVMGTFSSTATSSTCTPDGNTQ